MRTAASPARPDHDTSHRGKGWVLLVAIASCAAPTAFAQSVVPCTAIADDAERLACYDKALRPAAPAPRAVEAAQLETDDRRQQRTVRESTANAPAPAPVAPTAPRAGTSADEAIVPVVIVGIRSLPGREATFTAENGTSWVQTDSQRLVGLPDTPFAAEIKPGAMGSYFLVPTERGRAVRVRPAR